MMKSHSGVVVKQTALSGDCYRMVLHAPQLAQTSRAGQFVHILPRDEESSAPLLRRAFSIMNVWEGHVEILYRAVGRGTSLMARWQVGKQIDLLGPLGKPFAAPEHPLILIGGGVGTPPLVMLASQTRREFPDLPITACIAAKTASDVLGKEDFLNTNAKVLVATDDGSEGHHGFVTELLEKILHNNKAELSIYACGPLPMLRSVATLCKSHTRRAILSLEENMPCGIGVCNGCSLPVLNDGGDYHRYSRICVDGPSVWSDEINWDELRS